MTHKSPYASALSPEYPLLGFLIQQPGHGYRIHQQLTTEFGNLWRISLSQTYNILKRLEAQGFIVGQRQEREGTPARRCFQVTPEGMMRFEEWLDTPSGSSVRAIRVEFITRLYFALARNQQLTESIIEGQIVACRERLGSLQESLDLLPGNKNFDRLGLELRISQLEALLNWLPRCSQILDLQ
jgi:DNA-binding PadR family transcriptional regulator